MSRKRLQPVAAAFVVLIVLGFARWHAMNALPSVTIPPRLTPSPNAYDVYLDAAYAVVDEAKVNNAISSGPKPTKDVPAGQTSELYRWYTLKERSDLVAGNAKALEMVRKGLGYKCAMSEGCNARNLVDHVREFRVITRLLLLEGNVSAEKDDYGRAMRSYLDAIHLTMEYPRKSTMIHYLVGRAMQESSREAAWGVVEKLSAEEARWAAQRMQVLADHTVSLAEALESDKWFTVGLWQEQFRQGALPHVVVGSSIHYPAESNDDRVEIVKLYAKSLRYTKAQVIRNYISEMDERIADSRMPYSMRKRSWVISTDCLTEKEVDGYHHYRLMAANTDAQNRLLIVALALRAYYVENGGYPDTLTALQGKYLSRVPDDPFPSRGWLGYIRKGSGYVLYSVGPDGVDDGGRAIREPSYSQVNTRYCVEEDSSGDIVAGVNKYN